MKLCIKPQYFFSDIDQNVAKYSFKICEGLNIGIEYLMFVVFFTLSVIRYFLI